MKKTSRPTCNFILRNKMIYLGVCVGKTFTRNIQIQHINCFNDNENFMYNSNFNKYIRSFHLGQNIK